MYVNVNTMHSKFQISRMAKTSEYPVVVFSIPAAPLFTTYTQMTCSSYFVRYLPTIARQRNHKKKKKTFVPCTQTKRTKTTS